MTTKTDQQIPDFRFRVMWLAVILALLVSVVYLLIQQHILSIGDLPTEEAPSLIVFTAAAAYLIGGLLILLRSRWLWLVGAVMNALVILFFLQLYQNRPAIMFSPGGVISKVAELLLEIVLVYLIVADWWRSRRQLH